MVQTSARRPRLSQLIALDPATTVSDAVAAMDIVAKHSVRWEVWPEQAVVDGALRSIGFRVELHGRHHRPAHPPSPGCDECATVYRNLRRVAVLALPAGEHASQYEVQHFDARLQFDGVDSGEVVVTIRIVHKQGYFEPVDGCERACLEEIEIKLRLLGVHRGRGRGA